MKDVVKNMGQENAHKTTPYKVRIFGMVCVYKKRPLPSMLTEENDIGLLVRRPNDYDEFEFPQLAVNFNKKEMSNHECDALLRALCQSIKEQLKKAGVLK